MADELIDVVSENDEATGIQKMKSEAHKDGSWHRVAHIWIYNSKREVLLQLRAKNKKLYPDLWDVSAAGHVTAGEDVITSAKREIGEEIGIKINKDNLYFFKKTKVPLIYKSMINNEFYYIYFYRYDGDISNLKLQTAEVAQIKFVPINQIKTDYQKNPDKYTPNPKYWFEVLNALTSHNLSLK